MYLNANRLTRLARSNAKSQQLLASRPMRAAFLKFKSCSQNNRIWQKGNRSTCNRPYKTALRSFSRSICRGTKSLQKAGASSNNKRFKMVIKVTIRMAKNHLTTCSPNLTSRWSIAYLSYRDAFNRSMVMRATMASSFKRLLSKLQAKKPLKQRFPLHLHQICNYFKISLLEPNNTN